MLLIRHDSNFSTDAWNEKGGKNKRNKLTWDLAQIEVRYIYDTIIVTSSLLTMLQPEARTGATIRGRKEPSRHLYFSIRVWDGSKEFNGVSVSVSCDLRWRVQIRVWQKWCLFLIYYFKITLALLIWSRVEGGWIGFESRLHKTRVRRWKVSSPIFLLLDFLLLDFLLMDLLLLNFPRRFGGNLADRSCLSNPPDTSTDRLSGGQSLTLLTRQA